MTTTKSVKKKNKGTLTSSANGNGKQLLAEVEKTLIDVERNLQPISLIRETPKYPRTNIFETRKGYEMNCAVPGCSIEDIHIKLNDHHLVVYGMTQEPRENENRSIRRIENWGGSFYRRFQVNGNIQEEGITAKIKDGVLDIFLPKMEESEEEIHVQ